MNVSFLPIDAPGTAARWRTFIEKIARPTAFSSFHYARAISKALEYECFAVFAVSDGGDDTAGALLFARKKGPFSRIVVPPFTAYTPILTAPQSGNAVVRLIEALTIRFDDVRLHLAPVSVDSLPYTEKGWLVEPLRTYLIDVGSIDSEFRSWSPGPRRTYRKNASSYNFVEAPGSARDVIDLCLDSYRRHDRHFPAPPDRLEELVGRLQEKGMIRIFTVTPPGERQISGGIILLIDREEAAYWIAGSRPGPSMTVLIGRALLRLQSDGCERFDFIGANTPSIAEFKRRFGGILTQYEAVSYCSNRWLAFAKTVKKILN